MSAYLLHASIGLLPVAGLLAAMVYLDAYKLMGLRFVMAIVAAGAAVGVAAYFVNGWMIGASGVDFAMYSRYGGPVVEEFGKALVIVALFRAHRVGFLVDAAIAGFAVGTGFALVENLYYQHLAPDAGIATWIVRGFGTALMHGGTTAILAMAGLSVVERSGRITLAAFVPGFAIAVALHSAFNHLVAHPRASIIVVLVAWPLLVFVAFRRSERALGRWLGEGFDADATLLETINAGSFAQSHAGEYLASIKRHFRGEVVADLICYLRLHTELALRAKGLLMMRDSGFEIAVDDDIRAKLTELRYLASSVGKAGLLAIDPIVRRSHRDVWQLGLLEADTVAARPS